MSDACSSRWRGGDSERERNGLEEETCQNEKGVVDVITGHSLSGVKSINHYEKDGDKVWLHV